MPLSVVQGDVYVYDPEEARCTDLFQSESYAVRHDQSDCILACGYSRRLDAEIIQKVILKEFGDLAEGPYEDLVEVLDARFHSWEGFQSFLNSHLQW